MFLKANNGMKQVTEQVCVSANSVSLCSFFLLPYPRFTSHWSFLIPTLKPHEFFKYCTIIALFFYNEQFLVTCNIFTFPEGLLAKLTSI
jgi:hypothetical protein